MKVLSLLLRNEITIHAVVVKAEASMKVLSLLLRNRGGFTHGVHFTRASMKVLSLLLRNPKTQAPQGSSESLNESPELIAQEFSR